MHYFNNNFLSGFSNLIVHVTLNAVYRKTVRYTKPIEITNEKQINSKGINIFNEITGSNRIHSLILQFNSIRKELSINIYNSNSPLLLISGCFRIVL